MENLEREWLKSIVVIQNVFGFIDFNKVNKLWCNSLSMDADTAWEVYSTFIYKQKYPWKTINPHIHVGMALPFYEICLSWAREGI